jgi:hypothetical protein
MGFWTYQVLVAEDLIDGIGEIRLQGYVVLRSWEIAVFLEEHGSNRRRARDTDLAHYPRFRLLVKVRQLSNAPSSTMLCLIN